MARPKLPEGERRSHRIEVPMNAVEYNQLERLRDHVAKGGHDRPGQTVAIRHAIRLALASYEETA